MVTVWSKRAKTELKKIYHYILLDSLQNAEKVRDDIIELAADLSTDPLKYPPDKYKNDNDGTWRAFEKYHYRISYQIRKDKIWIVRLRHTSRSPLTY